MISTGLFLASLLISDISAAADLPSCRIEAYRYISAISSSRDQQISEPIGRRTGSEFFALVTIIVVYFSQQYSNSSSSTLLLPPLTFNRRRFSAS